VSGLIDAGLLAVFEHLPATDQENFTRWVSTGKDDEDRTRRTGILLHALSLSPLAWESRPGLPNGGADAVARTTSSRRS
jgi:hypothetical protein